MLLDIRETIRNSKPLKYTLITLISIPFALVGIGSYLGGGGAADVATVDGEPVSAIDLERAYAMQRQRIAQMFGGNIPDNFISDEQIREQALDGLVTSQVVSNVVEDQKFAVGDQTLSASIRNNPQFQVDGQFDPETYENILRSSRTNVAAYEASLRQETALNQFQQGIYLTSFTLPAESERLSELSRQTRTVDLLRYSIADAMDKIDVSDEDALAYFNENSDNYQFPERAKLEYVELNKADIAADIEISEEDAANYYDEFNARFVVPESRSASHILLEASGDSEIEEKTAQLEEIKARIVAGESFSDLAKEFSTDIGSAQSGGSLGQILPGAMVAPFEEGVYGLAEVGDLSDIIETEFGVHLIKLDSITPAEGKAFEEVKDEIIATMQGEEADKQFFELSEFLEESIASDPDTLSVAADAIGAELVETDWMDVDTTEGEILSHPEVKAAAFSEAVLEEQSNSDVITIAPGHLVSIRVLDHEGPRPKTIDDVKDEVVEAVKRERAEAQLDTSVEEAVSKLAAGTLATELADADELATATIDEVLTRQSTVIDNSTVSDIYALAKPAAGKTLIKSTNQENGDRVAYVLKSVQIPTEEAEEAPAQPVANPRLGQTELAAMLQSLRSQADVSIEDISTISSGY